MALKGTLKDFGIAEILQLIGQQAKSGVLHLQGREDEIHVALADGSVVRAEAAGRKANERLGAMLVRAEIISQADLDQALELQRRSLRRLGDLLVEHGFVSREDLREITQLQITETVYRLFHWKSGTYEFEPGTVEWDQETITPLRAESVLMEGFRRVDEWPLVRKRIPSLAMTFERRRPLDPAPASSGPSDEDAALDALGAPGETSGEKEGELSTLGVNERRAYLLANPGCTAEKIVDLSRLGEFETCKALATLVNLGYLEPVAPAGRAAAAGAYAKSWRARLRAGATGLLATVAIAAIVAGIAFWVDERGLGAAAQDGVPVSDEAPRRFLARYQLERLRGALEVYRFERGEYPAALGALVEAGLVSPSDLRFPWRSEYYYRRRPEGRFVLLPPLE
jgi:hypothetical protein